MSDSNTGKRTLEDAEMPKQKRVKLESFPIDTEWKSAEEVEYNDDSEYVPEDKAGEEEEEEEEVLEFVEEVEKEEAEEEEEEEAEEESIEELEEDEGEELEVEELQDILALSELVPEDMSLDAQTLRAIQQVAKDYMKEVFENAQLIASQVAKRDYVTDSDVKVAVEIMKKTTQNLPSIKLDAMAAL